MCLAASVGKLLFRFLGKLQRCGEGLVSKQARLPAAGTSVWSCDHCRKRDPASHRGIKISHSIYIYICPLCCCAFPYVNQEYGAWKSWEVRCVCCVKIVGSAFFSFYRAWEQLGRRASYVMHSSQASHPCSAQPQAAVTGIKWLAVLSCAGPWPSWRLWVSIAHPACLVISSLSFSRAASAVLPIPSTVGNLLEERKCQQEKAPLRGTFCWHAGQKRWWAVHGGKKLTGFSDGYSVHKVWTVLRM